MQSFALAKVAIFLASLHGVSALPTKDTTKTEISARETEFWYPPNQWNYPAANGPINANGANGGYNYGGSGANGGSIDIGRFNGGAAAVNANGANGGQNAYGNGANGGRISVGKREEEFLFPVYRPTYFPTPTANGLISATGANGGYNYGGDGANGGSISIGGREEEAGDFFFPIWRPYMAPVPANGAVNANGANGGYNYGGNGANGGSISVTRREEEAGEFLYPFHPWFAPPYVPVNGAISANGANGGTNYYGNGANGGEISVSKREEEAGEFFFPIWRPYQPQAVPANGAINANGANGGYNYGGDGANGGAISVGRA